LAQAGSGSTQLSKRFSLLHPAVMMIFFAGVILLTLLSYHPVILGLSLVFAALNVCVYLGPAKLWQSLKWLVPMAMTVVLFNTLFNRRGATELLTLGQYTFTHESLFFGLAIALMLAAVMLWFRLYQEFMTSDRFLYLFAPLAPTIALSITMVQRWIPLTKYRFEQVQNAQKMLNPPVIPGSDPGSWRRQDTPDDRRARRSNVGFYQLKKIRSLLRSLSALMSWSMEDAIQAADSMQARGYGAKNAPRRSSFRSYRLTISDVIILASLLALATSGAFTLFISTRGLGFFPTFHGAQQLSDLALAASVLLMSFPLLIEGRQQLQCLLSASKT